MTERAIDRAPSCARGGAAPRSRDAWRSVALAACLLACASLAACGDGEGGGMDAGTGRADAALDAPGLDARMPDAPGLDAAIPDAPGLDAPGLDAPPAPELDAGVDAAAPDAWSCTAMSCTGSACTLALDIDVPVATVSGRLTQGGATWPMTSTSSGVSASATAGFFLRSMDTHILHRIASISYGTTMPYTRAAGSDTYSSTILPGTYDLVYIRGENSGEVGRQFNADPVINGDRELRTVTIAPGPQTLDIDVPVATVSGRLTQGGATWPMTSTSSGISASATAGFFLRAMDTHVLHRIASISYSSTMPYTRTAGSDAYSSTILPGTYELVYVRGENSGVVSRQFNGDPVINGDRVLRTVTIAPGPQTLDIDVPTATVSGRLTQGGATWPMTSTSSGISASASADFYLRATDTHVLHRIASISYSSTMPYTRAPSADTYASTVPPGTYDLVYIRGESSGVVSRQFNGDPVINGDRVLRTVTITPGPQTLDIDVPTATVSGRLTQGGATWPMTSTSSGISASASADFYLRASDTQVLHRIASISYSSTMPYTRAAGTDAYSSTVPPGTYDLVYIRGENSGVVGRQFNADPVINGDRILRTVTIMPGTQTLDIDVPVATVSGRLTQGGGTWPMTSTSSGISASASADFYLRASDTHTLHRIASISYSSTMPYTRAAGTDAYTSTILPGTYDLVYLRGENGGEVGRQFNSDPVINGDRVLRTVTVTPGPQTLDIDVPVATVSGRLRQGGAAWPTTSTSSGISASASAGFFLRAMDTHVLHRIATISYSSTMPYTRPPSADTYTSSLMPGAYELVYIRGESSGVVGSQFNADPVINGDRVLDTCVTVP